MLSINEQSIRRSELADFALPVMKAFAANPFAAESLEELGAPS